MMLGLLRLMLLGTRCGTKLTEEQPTDGAYSVVQTSDGGYAMAGHTDSFGAGNYDFWLVKVDASGNAMWNQTYGGANSDIALSVVQTSDGGYAIAGETRPLWRWRDDFYFVKTAPELLEYSVGLTVQNTALNGRHILELHSRGHQFMEYC